MGIGADYIASTSEERPGRIINWMPLLIVIGAVSLASLSITLQLVSPYGGGSDYGLDFKIALILGFLSFTAFTVTIALVVYSREDQAKRCLVLGIVLIILLIAIRTEVYLRALWH